MPFHPRRAPFPAAQAALGGSEAIVSPAGRPSAWLQAQAERVWDESVASLPSCHPRRGRGPWGPRGQREDLAPLCPATGLASCGTCRARGASSREPEAIPASQSPPPQPRGGQPQRMAWLGGGRQGTASRGWDSLCHAHPWGAEGGRCPREGAGRMRAMGPRALGRQEARRERGTTCRGFKCPSLTWTWLMKRRWENKIFSILTW